MGRILSNWRIAFATLFAVLLVSGAYLLAKSVEYPSRVKASTESELLQAIATKDSDGDGLPDWQEALYGTDPHIVDTFKLGMSDGEAVARGLIVPKAISDIPVATTTAPVGSSDSDLPPPPAEGTLTAAFTKSFFTLYLAAKQNAGGADLTDEQIHAVASEALKNLAATTIVAPNFKTASDLVVYGQGKDALLAFAASAEAILNKNTGTATTTALTYLKSAVDNKDASALIQLTSLAKVYRGSALGIAALPVPAELAATDLVLVNALMRMSGIASDFARVDTDPLAAILALQQYADAAEALNTAFTNIGEIYATSKISLPANAPGALFVNMISDVEKRIKKL